MIDIFFKPLSILFQPGSFLAMIIGLIVGLVRGVMPGIGDPFALAMLMPFAYSMDPLLGVAMLVTLISGVGNGGSISAILLGIPGNPTNVATLIDGYQLTIKGQAGRALAACLTASAIGGIFGALVLIAVMPVMKTVILSFGYPERFMLAGLGISFVAILGESSLIKAIVAAALGFVIAFTGYDPISGLPRFDLGLVYLYDGFKILPLTLGLFALPEPLTLFPEKRTREITSYKIAEIMEDVKDIILRLFLLRCRIPGIFVGMIPGMGGDTAVIFAYAHARQTSPWHHLR